MFWDFHIFPTASVPVTHVYSRKVSADAIPRLKGALGFMKLQSWANTLERGKGMRQSWAGVGNIENCLCIIFDHYYYSSVCWMSKPQLTKAVRQLIYNLSYTRYQPLLYLWGIRTFLKYVKVPIYYIHDWEFFTFFLHFEQCNFQG